MGAWNCGIFDDDSAYDFVSEIEGAEKPREVFEAALAEALSTDYLEYDACHAVTVSAAYIDSILNGTTYRSDDETMAAFVEKNKDLKVDDLTSDAVKALQKVMGDNSELNELWSENEELYPKWKENIEQLIERLQ